MKHKRRRAALLAVIEGAILVGLVLVLRIDRTEWIIRMGVVQADRLILFSRIGLIVFAVCVNLALLLSQFKRKKRINTAPIKLSFAQDKVQNPEEIKNELTRFLNERPQLNTLLDQGLDQLDNIARKKEKMREILERNELSLLSEASGALNDAEQTLCRKLILVLNRALLCDPEEENLSRKKEVYAEHARYMQTFLVENEEVLDRCEKLLSETVHYVEEKKAGRDSMNLEIMTEVIQSLTNDGIHMEMLQGGIKG